MKLVDLTGPMSDLPTDCAGCGQAYRRFTPEQPLVQVHGLNGFAAWVCVECRRPPEVDPETGYELRPYERFVECDGKLAVVHLTEPVPEGRAINIVPNSDGTGRVVYEPVQ
jgi:hypothetical protein